MGLIAEDLDGQRHGDTLVVGRATGHDGKLRWMVRCSCGRREKRLRSQVLRGLPCRECRGLRAAPSRGR